MPSETGLQKSTIQEQVARGKERRKLVPRRAHGTWTAPPDRADPIGLLRAQDTDRMEDLVPIRWGRMSMSPFTFYRGAAALMASDLAAQPRTGLHVQLCGDAHLSNFGLYGSPERSLIFDVNDFDETLPGPFEWDVKRLAASFVIAARNSGFDEETARTAALAAARSYRQHMATYTEMRELDVWYSRVAADDLLRLVKTTTLGGSGVRDKAYSKLETGLDKTRTRDHLHAASRLTEVVGGTRRFVEQPPLIMHFEELSRAIDVRELFVQYTETLTDDRRALVSRFDLLDVARKVVGVGSVGTRCFIVLMAGRDENDPLILQVKQANRSVLEPYLGESEFDHSGHRVVAGQRLTQAASDIFLGWMTGQPAGRHFYWRQLRDMKGSIEVESLKPMGLELYAEICGWALARGHARSGQRSAINAYLGNADRFDQAIADFAHSYADQTEKDYEALQKAIKNGTVPVETGV